MKIVIDRGLDVSLSGSPKESGLYPKIDPSFVAIDLRPYSPLALRLRVKEGDLVTAGAPVAEYKYFPGTWIVSPVDGEVVGVRRGEKRALLDLLIRKTPGAATSKYTYDYQALPQKELLELFKTEGLFALFRQRPFDIPALPTNSPRDIFINLADNLPFLPPLATWLSLFSSREEGMFIFVIGVQTIAKAFGLKPHIVVREGFELPDRDLHTHAHVHTITGPYPSGSPSTHIRKIAAIRNEKDCVFTLTFQEALAIGHLMLKGRLLSERVIALAGSALPPLLRRYVITTQGAAFESLLPMQELPEAVSYIAGDPLTGRLCPKESFPCLGSRDHTITVLPIPQQRRALHFLRLGANAFTHTRAYLSAFLRKRPMSVDTNIHGETRPFIDTDIYQKVMAWDLPVVPLMKAVITKNFEQACELGLLEVSAEDFALPTMIDPSKIEMFTLVRQALSECAKTYGALTGEVS